MKLPETTRPFLWGAAAGALALAVVGFSWGGWVTGYTADVRAGERADTAVVAALTPVCVSQFRTRAGTTAPAKLEALKATATWQQTQYVLEGGWATMPGAAEPNRAVASSCAEALSKLTL